MSVVWTQVFQKNFCDALEKYSSDKASTKKFVDELGLNYSTSGDKYPGLGIEAKKFRLPLKAMGLGSLVDCA